MSARCDDAPPAKGFRLDGVVNGKVVHFTLWEGDLRVGSLEDSEIHLPAAGVSRRHAVIQVKDGRVVVRDTGSKNGTWVAGARIQNAELWPGDEIRFGPAVFQLMEADPEDGTVAIRMERRGTAQEAPGRRHSRTRTESRRSRDRPAAWVDLLDEVSTLLLGPGDPPFVAVLERLIRALGAEGAILAEIHPDGTPVVLASAGPRIPVLDQAEVHSRIAEARRETATSPSFNGVISWAVNEPVPCALAVASGATPESPGRILAVNGPLANLEAVPVLLRPILRMAAGRRWDARSSPAAVAPPQELPELQFPAGYVPGSSAAMRQLYTQLRQLLEGDIPVLITGETGVGKELVARILHASSGRREGPFVAVNCAAIPSDLLEAELFGIEAGVATGVGERPGKFQLANGGTIFLDEIADMSAGLQAKLLRTLQEMEVHPLGARVPIPVNVRVLSATNTDPQVQLAEGRFRHDLYFRVAGIVLRIPPLRERPEDIAALVEHFLRRTSMELGKAVQGLTAKALRLLVEAPWPGNVRELEHEVRRLVHLCPANHVIDSTLLSETVLAPAPSLNEPSLESMADLSLERHTAELEARLITLAMSRTGGNITRAAKLLGLSRNGLKNRMVRYGIEWEDPSRP